MYHHGPVDPGLAITVVGVALTLTVGLASTYNGMKIRELVRSAQELIKEESKLTRAH